MRKSVELYVDVILTMTVSIVLMPPLVYMTAHFVLQDAISFSYLMQVTVVYVFNSIAEHHVVTFALPEKWSGRVNKALQLLAIIFLIQGAVMPRTVEWWVYFSSFFPLDFIQWYIIFGLKAYNREIVIDPGMEVFYGVKLSTIM